MRQYVLRRVLASIPVFFIVSVGTFWLIHESGANAAVAISGGESSQAQVTALKHQLGLDRPLPLQYLDWLSGAVHGDFGRSLTSAHLPVATQIRERAPVSLELGVIALFVSLSISLPAGVLSAVRRNSLSDYAASVISLLGISVPGFALGLMALYLFAVKLHWMPVGGYVSIWQDPTQNLRVMLIPGIVLGLQAAGLVTRLTRAALLDVLSDDYVRTARAKGLPERVVVWRHALRNALLPIITVVALQIGVLTGGAFVTEVIFSLPGIGRLLVDGITGRDTYMVEGVLFVITVGFILANLTADLLYAVVDPRVRYS